MDRARSYSRAWYTASGCRMSLPCSLESSLSKTRQSWSSCPAFRSIKNDSRVSGIHETDSVIIAGPRGRISRKAMETTLSEWVTFRVSLSGLTRSAFQSEVRDQLLIHNLPVMIDALRTNFVPLDLNEAGSRKRDPATGSLSTAS